LRETVLPEVLNSLGLKSWPFSRAPRPEDLYRWPALEELLSRWRFVLETRGFALLTGEIGSGKSTALRAFTHDLDQSRHPSVYLVQRSLSPREFYARVLENFGVAPAFNQGRVQQQFQALLDDLGTAQGKTPVLIIDEGQEISAEMVQELRYIQNFHYDAGSPFALILAGQPELRGLLRLKAFEAVAQRITVRYHLAGLSLSEMTGYLNQSLTRAGLERPVFTEAALALLHSHSHGLMRRVSILATHALMDAAFSKTALVEETSVRRAIAEVDDFTEGGRE